MTERKLYRLISAAGVDMGVWQAESPAEAVELMRRDAGYASSEHAAQTLGTSVEALDAELTVVEIE